MSFSNPAVEVSYDGNGAIDSFSVPFDYLEGQTSSILVQLWDYTDPDQPVQQTYVENVDFTIDDSAYPATEINTTVPVATNFKITIQRATPTIQPVSFATGAFPAESVEEALDRAMFSNQEKESVLDRAIVNPIGATPITISEVQQTLQDTSTNTSDIATNATNIATNTSQIGTNTSAIGTNTSNIGTNLSSIGTNASAISTNADNISDNADNIQTNADDIAALVAGSSAEQVIPVSAAGTYNASSREIVLIQGNSVTVSLPAPVLHSTVRVKMDGLRASATITSTALIDGSALDYFLLSENESVFLVSDGTNWFII